jgi:hypothetical protein
VSPEERFVVSFYCWDISVFDEKSNDWKRDLQVENAFLQGDGFRLF